MNSDSNNKKKTARVSQLASIWPLITPYKKYIVLALILLLLGAVANLSLPVAFKQMIDLGFSSEHKDELSKYFLIVFVVAGLMVLFTSLRYYWVSWIGQRVVTDLRKKVYTQVLKQAPEFFERTKTGEILSRINTDTTLVETVVGSTFSVTLRSIVTFIGASIMMVVSSPKLAGMIAIMLPVIVIPIAITGRKIQKLSKQEQDKIADSSALATETINAIGVVQAYAQEHKEQSKFSSAINKAFTASVASIRMLTIMSMLVGFIVFSSIVFVLWMGAQDVINGIMTAGTLGQFVMYAIMAATTTGALSNVWGELKKASGALERITELMNTKPAITSIDQPVSLPKPISGTVCFKNINFAYPSRTGLMVLKNISIEIKAGETIALVGPSGAGKSTLFQLLMRFYEPQDGAITLDGININQLELGELRSQFSLVAQDVTIFSTTAADNIAYGLAEYSKDAVTKAANIAHADEFIGQLETQYQTYLGERGVRLSGGQAQRLSIARAIVTEPSVLLLDEATSALDAENERLVQDALNQIMQNRTTLVIAHRLATIRQADRIIVMDKGEVVAEGRHDELLKSSRLYAKLAKLQFTDWR
ncbi:Efflux ABC transporter, permease/ATP-binding protein [hydrothermal vent metagenome]|uniref:Efflux ABC transporter, permease/ATP-binding protein n=1 Tax=hydrothermal vent metagenome TaxID=652676 RepID=A0A3B0V072_9ZZZZ